MTYTLEDYCCSLHGGPWFGFNNINGNDANKTYANLVIHSSDAKPSEAACTAGIAALQAAYDGDEWKIARRAEYPEVGDQLDALYHDILNDKLDKTGTWFTAITDAKNTTTFGEILLDGTDGSSTNAGDKVLLG